MRLGGFAAGLLVALVARADVDARFSVEDVPFTAVHDGTTQYFVRMTPPGFDATAECDVLIALHGHGSDRWQFSGGDTPTGKAARDVAVERGILLILPDYRAKTSWMGPAAESDLVQIIATVRESYRVGRIFLCGGSMGASSSLTFAALHPDLIAGVAAMNGTANHLEYENFQDAIRESFGGTKQEIPMEYKNRSAEYWPERFTMPVAITASADDTVVPPGSVMRLADVLKKMGRPVLAIHRDKVGHTSLPKDARAAIEFVIDTAAPGAE